MYCQKCGTQLPDDSRFCTTCGAAQGGATNTNSAVQMPVYQQYTTQVPDKKRDVAFYISIFITPVLLIIHILNQREIEMGGWAQATDMMETPSMIAVSYILLIISIVSCVALIKTSNNPDKRKNTATIILCVLDSIVSNFIILFFYRTN